MLKPRATRGHNAAPHSETHRHDGNSACCCAGMLRDKPRDNAVTLCTLHCAYMGNMRFTASNDQPPRTATSCHDAPPEIN